MGFLSPTTKLGSVSPVSVTWPKVNTLLVSMTEWVNIFNLPYQGKTVSSPFSPPSERLLFYAIKEQVLNKQAINQHVFMWDSSWKHNMSNHSCNVKGYSGHIPVQRGPSMHLFPAQVSGTSSLLSECAVNSSRSMDSNQCKSCGIQENTK